MNHPMPAGLDCRVWNGVEIQRRPSDGYVNATAMCKANGKLWKNYHQNERSQAYWRDGAKVDIRLLDEGDFGADELYRQFDVTLR